MIKYETQTAIGALAGAIVAGTKSRVLDISLDAQYKKCIGIKIYPVDNAGLLQYDIGLQHNELIQRDPVDSRDFKVDNGNTYLNTFKPINISAGGTMLGIDVKNTVAIAPGQTLKFQVILLLTNEENTAI